VNREECHTVLLDPSLDLELARRVERDASEVSQAMVQALKRNLPREKQPLAIELESGGKVMLNPVSPGWSKAVGWGLDRAVDEAEVAHVEEVFRQRGYTPACYVTPVHHPTLMESLLRRGWTRAAVTTLLQRPLTHEDLHWMPPSGITLDPPMDLRRWAEGMSACFRDSDGPQGDNPEQHLGYATMPGVRNDVLRVDGVEAGYCNFLATPSGLANIMTAGVLKQHRGHGYQRIMIRHRFRIAVEMDLDLAVLIVWEKGASRHNAEACGMVPAYERWIMKRQ